MDHITYEISGADTLKPLSLPHHNANKPCPLCLVSEDSEAYQYLLQLENAQGGKVCGKALAALQSKQYHDLFVVPMREAGKECDDIPPEDFERHFTEHKPSARRVLRDDILKFQTLQDAMPMLDMHGNADAQATKTYSALVRLKMDLLVQYERLCEQAPNLPPVPDMPQYLIED